MAQFGEILTELCQDHGLTQKELAKIFFVTPGTISNYEKGRHLPDAERLLQIADYFSVTTDYLLGRSSFNLPTDVLSAPLVDELTAGEMIQLVQALSPERKRALRILLRDMHFGSVIGQYNHKEGK